MAVDVPSGHESESHRRNPKIQYKQKGWNWQVQGTPVAVATSWPEAPRHTGVTLNMYLCLTAFAVEERFPLQLLLTNSTVQRCSTSSADVAAKHVWR